jgi:hypothetical protein
MLHGKRVLAPYWLGVKTIQNERGRQLRRPYFVLVSARLAFHALTTVKTGSGHSNTLIQCNIQYRARLSMARS